MLKKKFNLLVITSVLTLSCITCEKTKPLTDIVDFEDLVLESAGVWNGSDGSGGFKSGNLFFVNHYNNQYQSWYGFAYTNHTDVTTADYSNQYSSITGSGADGSEKYGVFYYSGTPDTITFTTPEKVTDISVSNSTYAYMAIKTGNQFCKKFGGDDGNDADWFKLTLTAINSSNQAVGSVDIYLADFRYTDNSRDYISNLWTNLDLSTFGFVKALKFEMSSSDSGVWGMNNPAYVCVDNIQGELVSVN